MRRKLFWIVLLLLGISFSYLTSKEILYLKRRERAWDNLRKSLEEKLRNFKGEIGVLIKDLEKNWEISFNKEKIFPAASLIKVPIMLAFFYAQEEGKLDLRESIKLKNSDKVLGSGILKNLPPGKTFTLERLIELMITVSDNTATNLLIERLGFAYLNAWFKKMGLKNTNLIRKMMDFRYRNEGMDNFTTVQDMAYILEMIYRKKMLNKDISKKCLNFLLNQKYRDRIPAKLPRGTKVAHKTGLEKNTCHDAGIVFGPKGDFLILVLTKGEKAKIVKELIGEISLLVYNYYFEF